MAASVATGSRALRMPVGRARHILRAIEKRKRTLVLTFQGKVTVLLNKIFPSLADRLTYNHYYKNGEFVK